MQAAEINTKNIKVRDQNVQLSDQEAEFVHCFNINNVCRFWQRQKC